MSLYLSPLTVSNSPRNEAGCRCGASVWRRSAGSVHLFSPRMDSQLRGAVLLGRRSQSAVESNSPHATARLHAPRPLPRCRGRPAGFGLEPTATSRPGALRLGGKPGKAARALGIHRQGCCSRVRRSPSLFGFGGGTENRAWVLGFGFS